MSGPNFVLQSANLPKSCRVTVTMVNESTFTGVIHSVDKTSGKIILKNVITGGSKLHGPQIFYCKDISDLQVVSDVQDPPNSPSGSAKTRRSKQAFPNRKHIPNHIGKLKNIDDDGLVLSNILRDELGDTGFGSEDDDFEDFYVTEGYTLICRISEKFYDAIDYIMEQETVAVAVDGQMLGRDGILSLVQISTDCELIIFDIMRLGEEAFKAGLGAVFEADGVMKVIHDCRWIADLLRCQFNVSMSNIFDTQVANAFVYRSLNNGDWPRFVESLPGLLLSYLDLAPGEVQFTQIRERCRKEDEAVWLVRPLPEKLLDAATKNTVHLLRLQQVLLVEMLMEFKTGVGIYLNHVSGTKEDVEKCRATSHLLPYAFTDIHTYVNHRPASWERFDTRSNRKGFRDNEVALPNKNVIFSHDSPWHKNWGRGFSPNLDSKEKQNNSRMLNSSRVCAGIPAEEKRTSGPRTFASSQKHSNTSPESKCNGSVLLYNKPESESMIRDNTSFGQPQNCYQKNNHIHPEAESYHKMSDQKSKNDDIIGSFDSKRTMSDAEPSLVSNESAFPNVHDSTPPPLISESDRCHKASACVTESDSSELANIPQGVGHMLQKSRLWRMSQEQNHKTSFGKTKRSNLSPQKQVTDTAEDQSNQKTSLQSNIPSHHLSEEEQEQAKELQRQMALLDQLHFVPADAAAAEQRCTTQQKHSSGQHSDSSSSSGTTSRNLTTKSRNPASLESFDNDRQRPLCIPSEADLRREKLLNSSAFMPAGMHEIHRGKSKKKRQLSTSRSTASEPAKTKTPEPAAAKELDFSLIPTPQSLLQRKEHALGVSPIGMGNPFSEDEGFSTPSHPVPSAILKSRLLSPQGGDDETISDVELDKLLKSEKSQRILKLASLKSSTNVRDKILPLPAKARSPQCGSS